MSRARRDSGGGAARRSERTGGSGPASGASGFDDDRASAAGRMWLDLAGLAEDEPETTRDADSSPAVPAAETASNPGADGEVEADVVALDALLTRASDLPGPAPDAGARVLPWSAEGVSPARPGKTRRPRPKPDPESGPEGEGERRRRRPGPAPLPEDPREREEAAREVVLRQLGLGPRSRRQLERKLTEREAEPELITRVLDRFEEVRLVDDAAFAEVWVRSRHRSRGLARRAIGHELSQKGVDREIAEEALEAIDGEDERAAALDLVRKRMRGRTVPGGAGPEAREERDRMTRRLVGMLGRRGYGGGMAFAVVKEVLAEHEA